MSESNFFAMISRMKYIDRWALMRNSVQENISEHSLEVGMIAHLLATMHNVRFGGSLNADRAALIGMYHDSSEILTGDMPTPVKYYNPEIRDAFKAVENIAQEKLLSMLPEDLRDTYRPIFFKEEGDEYLWRLVKAADKISGLIKCIEEEKYGNTEFVSAKRSQEEAIRGMQIPEADMFLDEFLPSYYKTLDELN